MLEEMEKAMHALEVIAQKGGVHILLSDDTIAGLLFHLSKIGFSTEDCVELVFYILHRMDGERADLQPAEILQLFKGGEEDGEDDDGGAGGSSLPAS